MVEDGRATGAEFVGSSIVITGSSRGIGLAVARELVARGAAVVINGRDAAVVREAADALRSDGGEAVVVAVPGSAAEPDVLARMVEEAERIGDLSGLVCCAGTAEPQGSSILSIDPQEWHELIDAHLTSTFVAARAVAPRLVARGGGAIVTTSSHAFTGVFGGTGYAAGKGGVNSLTLALAAELREHGIRVNAVCPGARTRLSTGEDYERGIEDLHRRGLLDDLMHHGALSPAGPEHVARLYAYLVSDLAAGISGEVLSGAGGYLGRFSPPAEMMLAYRDHDREPAWTLAEIDEQLSSLREAGDRS